MRGKKNISFIIVILISVVSLAVILYGQKTLDAERSCKLDSDCACGVNIRTQECFYGNKNYVNAKQCPDFCSGFAGNLQIKCVSNECRQVKIK